MIKHLLLKLRSTSAREAQVGMAMLEALLALTIFSLVATALLNISGGAIHQHRLLMEARCANWLGENLLTQALLSDSRRSPGEWRGVSTQCDISWQWRMVRQKTADERFYLLSVEIQNSKGQRKLERQIFQAR